METRPDMDNEQAKLILSAYRPGGEDASDPLFTAALEQVRLDPELGQWFAEQRRFDQSVRAALESDAVPAELRESLLFNRKVVRMQESAPRSRRWFRQGPRLALVASLVLLLGTGLLLRHGAPEPMTGQHFVQHIVDLKKDGGISLGKTGGSTAELRAWLAQREAPSDFDLPAPLSSLGAVGCQTFAIDGRQVSLLCFMLDKDRLVHFFVIDSNELEDIPGSRPEFHRVHNIAATTWSAAGRTYVLVGENIDEEALRQLI